MQETEEKFRQGRGGVFIHNILCNSSIGRKIKNKENMHKTDESDLGNSDNNPPSMGGWSTLISGMNIT